MVQDKKFIPSLTGIRAISAYLIFFYHLNFFSPETQPTAFLILNQFYTFTTFFFVLSGFIICYKYYETRALKKVDLFNYFINRISRIFPVLFILTTITFLLQYIYHLNNTSEIIKTYIYNITLLKGFSTEYKFTGIGPSWSISVEELFYTLSPFLFFFITKKSNLLKTILVFYALGILFTFLFSHISADGFFSDYKFTAYFTFFGRIFEFACGIFLAFIVKGKFKPGILKSAGKYTLMLGWFIIILSVLGLYCAAKYYHVQHAPDSWTGLFINNIIMPIGITLILYSLIYHKTILQKFLESKLMVALGSATYSFYLLHTTFMLSWIEKYISKNLIITFISMVIFSYIFFRLIEQPLAKLIRKKFTIKKTVTTLP
ncbi:MAG: acyltransferase [Ferruginibacter sp.]